MLGMLQDDPNFRQEVRKMLETFPDSTTTTPAASSAPATTPSKPLDAVLTQHFPGARITPFKANDIVRNPTFISLFLARICVRLA